MPPGIGVIQPATSLTASKSTSPDESLLGTRDADVDHGRARLDVLGGDHPRLTRRGDDDVGLTAEGGEVGGAAVGDRHRGVNPLAGEQQGDRQADECGAADDDGALAGDRHVVAFQQPHHAERCARHEAWLTADQPAERAIGQPVDILVDR